MTGPWHRFIIWIIAFQSSYWSIYLLFHSNHHLGIYWYVIGAWCWVFASGFEYLYCMNRDVTLRITKVTHDAKQNVELL